MMYVQTMIRGKMIVQCNSKLCTKDCEHRKPHERRFGCQYGKCPYDIKADCVNIEEIYE